MKQQRRHGKEQTTTPHGEHVADILNRLRSDATTIDLHFRTPLSWRIPRELNYRPVRTDIIGNDYLTSRPVLRTRHFSTPSHPNGWDIYIDQPFDPDAYWTAQPEE